MRATLRRFAAVVGIAAVTVVAGCAVPLVNGETDTAQPGDETASAAADVAEDFLDDFVQDGRVVRTDQGGDTVSEGQAYGLLLAVVADDEEQFDRIWNWTTEHIQRDDLLLAWRWQDGAVIDPEPASDADLDAARALVLAGEAFDRPDLHADGLALGDALLDEMTAMTERGRILLPGMWAMASPHAYNPSYASPAAYDVLAEASDDSRWQELADGSRATSEALLDTNSLPTDWATVAEDGAVAIAGSARGDGEPQYGYDAARLPIRFAESCDAADTAVAARVATALPGGDGLVAVLDAGSGALTTDRHAIAYAARAAAHAAGGDAEAASADLGRMTQTAQATPTYYGDAWNALSIAMLTERVLGGCPPLETSGAEVGAAPASAAGPSDAGGLQDPVPVVAASGALPERISIPVLGIDSDLVPLALGADGWIEAPSDYDDIGWYERGVLPGEIGPAVIAGHVDSPTTAAIFHDLPTLVAGDTVTVTRSDGTAVEFVVTGIQIVEKEAFPTASIYAPAPTPELRLVTCGGAWDPHSGHYVDNIVVTAVAA